VALSSEPLVGRAAELGSLEEALARFERHGFTALEISGEPGIGKTRLLAELSRAADQRGHLVLSGAASELEADLPFCVFVDALDEFVHGLPPHRLDELGGEALAGLAHVLPALAPDPQAASQTERHRVHGAVRALLELLAGRTPLVLVLDDLHWADSGSLELLGALLRRPPSANVLVALAVRPRQMPPLLAAALERARPSGALVRLQLSPLSETEARELLGDGVDAEAARRLYADSGGNPFYLEQLARHEGSAGTNGAAGALGALDVPPAVAASLVEELALLEPATRQVLAGAAVAGDPFEPELAAAAAGSTDAEAIAALDALLDRDLVRHTDVPRRFRFRHPLVRGAVYAATPGGWRLGAHERSATALAARGAPAAARAHHVEFAGRHGDPEAIALLAEAGREVLHRTPAGAARWFSAALRLLPADAPPEQHVGLLLALAGALAATGRFDEARDAVLEGLELSPPDAIAQRLELIAACAWYDILKGEYTRAQARLEAAIAAYPDAPAAQAVQVMMLLSDNGIWRVDFEYSRTWAQRAYARAEADGDPGLVTAAGAGHAIACALAGHVDEGRRVRDQVAARLDAMSDREAAASLISLSQLASGELYLDRLVEGAAHSARSVELARATKQVQLFPMLEPARGIFLGYLGRLEESRALLDGACEAGRLGGDSHALAWGLFTRGMTLRQIGDVEAAIADGEEALALARRSDPHNVVALFAGLTLGVALLERGDAERAIETMCACAGGSGLPLAPGAMRGYYLGHLAQAFLASGHLREAAAAAAAAAELAEATGLLLPAMAAERASAAIALDAGDPVAAAGRARASAGMADALGTPIEAALSRLLEGRALAAAGRGDEALRVLQSTASVFDECGALRYRNAAERELRRLGGRRPHRRTRAGQRDASGVESLTERELQVARLIVDRRTNPQIAAELFLSPKTVESHVRNLFHKLGVSSRVEVARVVERAAEQDPV
jgi:DNA-binding NarL/FixJ family response regulator/tetratricopeptide (TPR) repeat protein